MDERFFQSLARRSQNEPFGRLFGFEVVEIGLGFSRIRMKASSNLHNIFGSLHGGAIFALLDEAFQLACNSHGIMAVALNVSVTYISAPGPDSVIEACAEEIYCTKRTASYACRVIEPHTGKLIATAQALAYRTQKNLEERSPALPTSDG